MELLSKAEVKYVAKVMHGIMDGLCHRASLQYKDFSEVWDMEQWWTMNDAVREFCQKCVSHNWSKDQMAEELVNLSEDHKNAVTEAINVRRSELRAALVEALSDISHDKLIDFDWQVKLVMASDSIAQLQQPLASVDFCVQDHNSSKVSSLELSHQDMKKMIASLEACNKAVTQLKT